MWIRSYKGVLCNLAVCATVYIKQQRVIGVSEIVRYELVAVEHGGVDEEQPGWTVLQEYADLADAERDREQILDSIADGASIFRM